MDRVVRVERGMGVVILEVRGEMRIVVVVRVLRVVRVGRMSGCSIEVVWLGGLEGLRLGEWWWWRRKEEGEYHMAIRSDNRGGRDGGDVWEVEADHVLGMVEGLFSWSIRR